MTLTKITVALIAATAMTFSVAGSVSAKPQLGPQDLQMKPNPKFPGPGPKGPKDFAPNPKGGKGGKGYGYHGYGPAYGALFGIGVLAAAAAQAADDDTVCWKEKHQGQIYLVCAED